MVEKSKKCIENIEKYENEQETNNLEKEKKELANCMNILEHLMKGRKKI